METLRVAQVSQSDAGVIALGRSRRGAALVAFAFPIFTVALLAAGLKRRGFESLGTHAGLIATLPVGIVALAVWCRRYWGPALTALRNPVPIELGRGVMRVNGQPFTVTETLSVESDVSVLKVLDGDKLMATFPGYFIRLREPG